jgi:hypothetical protein
MCQARWLHSCSGSRLTLIGKSGLLGNLPFTGAVWLRQAKISSHGGREIPSLAHACLASLHHLIGIAPIIWRRKQHKENQQGRECDLLHDFPLRFLGFGGAVVRFVQQRLIEVNHVISGNTGCAVQGAGALDKPS